MKWRLLTNIVATLFLIAFIAWCIMIFKTTGWEGLLYVVLGIVLNTAFRQYRGTRKKRKEINRYNV